MKFPFLFISVLLICLMSCNEADEDNQTFSDSIRTKSVLNSYTAYGNQRLVTYYSGSYVIIHWLHSKIKFKNKNVSFLTSVFGSVFLVSLMVIFSVWMLFFLNTFYIPKFFDKSRWDEYPEQRYVMKNDLIYSKKPIGKSKNEVGECLGAGDHERNIWIYGLGEPEGLFLYNLEYYFLEISFANDTVQKVTFFTSD